MIDLKAKRECAGLTQMQLSDASGVKRTTIAMIETGKNLPSVETAKALANALDFNWAEFFEDGGEDTVTNSKGSSIAFTG